MIEFRGKQYDIVTLDFETFYDTDYTLAKMPTSLYVRDPRFLVHLVGIKTNDQPTQIYERHKAAAALRAIDWRKTLLLCHNTAFDGFIVTQLYGCKPAGYLDTLSMARAVLGHSVSHRLDAVGAALGLGGKEDADVLVKTKGLQELPAEDLLRMGVYCARDVSLCYDIFWKMYDYFPDDELELVDLTIRMFCEPMLRIDRDLAEEEHHSEIAAKVQARLLTGVTKDVFLSNEKFAAELRARGVIPPMKRSPATGKLTYAFSKTDAGLRALLNHTDPYVVDLVKGRLAMKSTIGETRALRFLEAADAGGTMPVLLNYYGAHCVPGDTEVLTTKGWQRLDRWNGGEIMQVFEDLHMEFLPATVFKGPVTADWLDSSAVYLPGSFTRGHTMPYLQHETFRWATLPAAEMAQRASCYVPLAGLFTQGFDPLTPAQARVLAMVQADGYWDEHTKQLVLPFTKPRKQKRARELLQSANVRYKEAAYPSHPGETRFKISYPDAPNWLDPSRKYYGAWLLELRPEAREAIATELQHWDGWTQGGQQNYSTSNEESARWLQTMLHLTGRSATITAHKQRGNRQINYRLAIRQRNYAMVKRGNLQPSNRVQQAFCAQTRTGFWLARKDGKIFVTGNTGRWSGGDKMNLQNLPRPEYGPDKQLIPTSGRLRRSLLAPPGNVLVVADSAQIEARVNAWLSGQNDLLDIFRRYDRGEGPDSYKVMASELFNTPIDLVTSAQRFVGKICRLALGYGMGPPKLQDTLDRSGVQIDLDTAARYVDIYRRTNNMISRSWKTYARYLPRMTLKTTQIELGPLTIMFEAVRLPNGLFLRYPDLQLSAGDWSNAIGEASFKGRNGRTKLYGGLLCIAEGTLVLSTRGWIPLETVRPDDLIHDGVEFVPHGGLVYKSVQECVTVDGVEMTPEHEVLTDAGWKPALEKPEPYRPDFRTLNCRAPRGFRWEEDAVGMPVRLQQADRTDWHGTHESGSTRAKPQLRVPDAPATRRKQNDAQHVAASAVSRVAQYARTMRTAFAQGLEKLWRPRDTGSSGLVAVHAVPGGYATDVSPRTDAGPDKQRSRLLRGELPLGGLGRTSTESARQGGSRRGENRCANGYPEIDAVLPPAPRTRPVYDIIDCGPRRRFVVAGTTGPFIVHNCENFVQALSRCIIAEQVLTLSRAGYRMITTTHDEIVITVPSRKGDSALAKMIEVMSTPPEWAPDLPLAAEGAFAKNYCK